MKNKKGTRRRNNKTRRHKKMVGGEKDDHDTLFYLNFPEFGEYIPDQDE